jgi:hypothetical protein
VDDPLVMVSTETEAIPDMQERRRVVAYHPMTRARKTIAIMGSAASRLCSLKNCSEDAEYGLLPTNIEMESSDLRRCQGISCWRCRNPKRDVGAFYRCVRPTLREYIAVVPGTAGFPVQVGTAEAVM